MIRARTSVCPLALSPLQFLLGFARRADEARIHQHFGQEATYLHKGRTAISLLCRHLKLGRSHEILVPSYNCGSEIDALIAHGLRLSPFRIRRDTSIDFDDLAAKITPQTGAIYIIHYFGWGHDLSPVRALCSRKGLVLIEDCALSLFTNPSLPHPGTWGDAAFWTLSKSLAVPDGAFLKVHPKLGRPVDILPKQPLGRILSGSMPLVKRWIYANIVTFLNYSRNFAAAPTTNLPPHYHFSPEKHLCSGSRLARTLFSHTDALDIVRRRRYNYLLLNDLLRPISDHYLFNILPPGVCPLGFPLLSKNRMELIAFLAKRNVYANAWWSGYHESLPWTDYPDACYLKDSLVLLPIHQQLSRPHIEYIAQTILAFHRKAGASTNTDT